MPGQTIPRCTPQRPERLWRRSASRCPAARKRSVKPAAPLPRCPAAQRPIRLMIRRVPRSRCLGLNPSGSAVCHDASSVRRYPPSARAVRSRCASVTGPSTVRSARWVAPSPLPPLPAAAKPTATIPRTRPTSAMPQRGLGTRWPHSRPGPSSRRTRSGAPALRRRRRHRAAAGRSEALDDVGDVAAVALGDGLDDGVRRTGPVRWPHPVR